MGGGSGVAPGGVQATAITEDPTNGKLVYDPSHPDANAQGYVRMPNVDTVTEMVDLIDAQRAYEANVTAMSAVQADVRQDPGDPPLMTIDPSFAVSGAEWQIQPVEAPTPAGDAAGSDFGSMLGESHLSRWPRPRTTPPRRRRRSPPARPTIPPRSSWPSSARSSRCSSRARSAPRPSRPPRTSSTPRSDLNHAAVPPKPPRPPGQDQGAARRLRRRDPRDRVHHAQDRHGAVVRADRERPRSRPDRQDHRRARRAGHRLRAAQQRHGARRRRSRPRRRRASRSPARACRPRAAAPSPATSCSTSPSSAPRSSSSRSPTSARWRVRSPGRCPASRASRTRHVQIVMPQDDLFADEASPATAAISSATPPTRWRRAPCAAWRRLAASSVKGLKTENVTITDSTGAVLWPSDEAGGAGGGGSSKASAEARYARQMESRDQRDARVHARPGQGAGQGQRRPQHGRDHARRS